MNASPLETMMTPAEAHIRRLVQDKDGHITFAEFMEAALYGPGGYYASGEPTGTRGGYYTSPQAHPVFGALIALQLEQMWRLMGAPEGFTVVEAGAGGGTLARDILGFARGLESPFWRALRYVALDRSSGTAPTAESERPVAEKLSWVSSTGIPLAGFNGCVLSNELIDAMPVHRVAIRGGRLLEAYVTLEGDQLTETLDAPSTPALEALLERQGVRLQEGWDAEVSLLAADWMAEAANALERGYVLTFDYGAMAERLFTPERRRGTLMCYYRHTPESDPYARIGRQDITAHANFTTLVEAGAAAGLTPIALTTQRAFLQALGLDLFLHHVGGLGLSDPERQANLMAMRELAKPEGLGAFRVLTQAKGAPVHGLAGLGQAPDFQASLRQRLHTMAMPLLGPEHIDLMYARYPHLRQSWGLSPLAAYPPP